MANFDDIGQRMDSAYQALDLFNMWRNVYQQAAELHRRLSVFTTGKDPLMAAIIATVVTPEEMQELGAMRVQIEALLVDWDANHRRALGLPDEENKGGVH